MNASPKFILEFLVKCFLSAFVYVVSILLGGGLASAIGLVFPDLSRDMNLLVLMLFLSGLFLSICVGLLLTNLELAFHKKFLIVFTVLFVNTITQLAEGVFFSSGSIHLNHIPALLFQQFITFLLFSSFCVLVFRWHARRFSGSAITRTTRQWILQFGISSGSYVLFYYVFGKISFTLFTNEYYSQNLNGLSIPNEPTILIVETARALLLILSVVPVILSLKLSRRGCAVIVGLLLSVVGGVNPMLQQVGFMPTKFLVASGVEMTMQFFMTAIVSVCLLYPYQTEKAKTTDHSTMSA